MNKGRLKCPRCRVVIFNGYSRSLEVVECPKCGKQIILKNTKREDEDND